MPVIDVHAHIFPQSAVRACKEGRDWFGTTITKGKTGPATLKTGGFESKYRSTDFWIPHRERIPHLDRLGIDFQLLSCNPQLLRDAVDRRLAIDCAKSVNEEIAEAVEENPDRFGGLGILPLQDTNAAVAELNRSMTELGLKGFIVASHVDGRRWDEDAFFPVLQEAERTGAFILLHPFNNRIYDLMPRYHLINLIGNPMETTVAAASLILGGTFDRLPNLRICLSHAGGYLPFASGRFDHAFGMRDDVSSRAERAPSDYLRCFYYDCISHSDAGLEFVVDTVGADRILVGTDFPADMGLDEPGQWLDERTYLSAGNREMIKWKNAASLGLAERVGAQAPSRASGFAGQ